MQLLEWALRYVARGLRVLVLHTVDKHGACSCGRAECPSPGKHPRTRHGVKDATSDPDQIRKWVRRWPDSNIALATGRDAYNGAGLLVVDIDLPDGPDSVQRLYDEGKVFPATLTQTTGSGGVHYLFSVPPGQSVPNVVGLEPGIDIKGDGGYIVVAPSRHASGGRYVWQS